MTTDETPTAVPAPTPTPTETQPTEALPTETQPTEALPTEALPTTEQPSAQQPTAPQPTAQQPTAPLPAEPWLTPTPPSDWAPATASAARPPVRWGGVVWGLLLVAFAGGMLFVLSAPERLAAVEVWLSALTPGSAWALWLAVAGVLIVVFALLGAIRSSQRRRHPA